jgi:serine/threonine protein kinase
MIYYIRFLVFFFQVGKPPFETNDIKQTYKRIRANHYSFPSEMSLSDYFKGLVLKILQLKPEYRPSLEDIERRYDSMWIFQYKAFSQ